MNDLTAPQEAMLREIPGNGGRWSGDAGWIDGAELLRRLPQNHSTTQGVHRTAASLVRRGYAMKSKVAGHGVEYRITEKGVELLRAIDSLRSNA